jgi:hypothetical protein
MSFWSEDWYRFAPGEAIESRLRSSITTVSLLYQEYNNDEGNRYLLLIKTAGAKYQIDVPL